MQAIPTKFRAALLAKGALLATLAALFIWLGIQAWSRGSWHITARIGVTALAAGLALFLGWAASLALMDVVLGQAVRETGAVPLRGRRSGYSLKLPSGKHVEYILFNPWQKLQQGATYAVLYGRHSGVLVAAPEPEDGPPL